MKTINPFVHWHRAEVNKSRLELKELLREEKKVKRMNHRVHKILKKHVQQKRN